MKKLSVLMSIILSGLFFVTVFFSMGNSNYIKSVDVNDYFLKLDLSKEKAIRVLLDDSCETDKECQKFLLNLFKKYHVVAIGVAQTKGIEAMSNISYICAETDIYEHQFSTVNGKRIDFSDSQESLYYTMDEKDEKGLLIDLLNPMFYGYSNIFSMHPFHQVSLHRMPILINIDGITVEEFQKEVSQTPWKDKIVEISPLNRDLISSTIKGEGIQYDAYHLLEISMGLSLAGLILLIIVDITKEKKYIAVARLNGISRTLIIRKKFIAYLGSLFAGFSITQLTLALVICGSYRSVTKELYHVIFLAIGGFLLLMLVILAFLYVYIWMFCDFQNLKNRKMNLASIRINIMLKIGLTIFLIAPFMSLMKDTHTQLINTTAMYQMKEESEHRYMVNLFIENESLMKEIKAYLCDELNCKTFSIEDWLLRYHSAQQEGNPETCEVPFFIVNRNYLKDYEVKDYETKKSLDVEQMTNGVLLVPKRYENSISLKNYQGQLPSSKVIMIEDLNHSLRPLNFLDYQLAQNSFINPIIYVVDESDERSSNYLSILYIDTQDMNASFEMLKKKGYDEYVNFVSMIPAVELEYNKQFITFSSMSFMLVGYLCVYLSFVFQNVYVYLDIYKKKLSIQYLQGYSYWKRYAEIYFINLCSYVIAGMAAFALIHVELKDVIIYIMSFGIIEILFILYQIHHFERKSGTKSLK